MSSSYNLSQINEFTDLLSENGNSLSFSLPGSNNILKLNNIECRSSNNANYKIIRYDKNSMSVDLVSSYGLCRSVIINSNNNVVGFAPPKSVSCDVFISKYENTENIIAEEFVEGTMINVFWDQTLGVSGGWEISTRNIVGATSCFYKTFSVKSDESGGATPVKSQPHKNFRDMFLEAANINNISFSRLNPCYSYSFVLQHPDNRIVVPCKVPKLYLVAVYFIETTPNREIIVHPQDMEMIKKSDWTGTTIYFPERYTFNSYSELVDKYGSMNTPYNVMGVVLYNTITGERAKIRNPVYENVRNLRGNQPKLQYQFLCLRREGKVGEFLKFYSENKKSFSEYRDGVHLFTTTLYENYVACYIKKERPLREFNEQYRSHMYNLHQIYINELMEDKRYVNKSLVKEYVNNIHPSLLMYCLNYQMRKRRHDEFTSSK